MKVICVDNSMNESVHKDFKSCPLIEGNVYTVIGKRWLSMALINMKSVLY